MIVATDVMRIGRNRIRPASSTADIVSIPFAFSWFVYSTSRIEFLLTRPIRRIIPIWLYKFIVAPDRWMIAANFRVASAPRRGPGRQQLLRDRIDRIERLALREPRHERRRQRERGDAVEVIDLP